MSIRGILFDKDGTLLASGTTDEIAARWGRWRRLTDTEIWPLF